MKRKSDIIILGGGAVGLCSAYYLAGAGATVTVIDKGEMGHGCSLHNAGYVCPSHFVPLASPGIMSQGLKWMLNPVSPFYVKPRLDLDLVSWMWKFRRSCTREHVRRSMPLLRDLGNESLRLYKELTRVLPEDFDFTTRGLLILYRTERGKRSCAEEAELAHEIGVDATLLGNGAVQAMEPDVELRADGGLYFPHDCHMTPAKFVSALASSLEARGVTELKNTDVTGFGTTGRRVSEVRTSRGNLTADQFVVAGGSWSSEIVRTLGIKLPLQGGKGYSVTIQRKNKKPLIPMILSEARVALTSMGDTFRVAGTMELAGLDLSITQRRVDAIVHALPNYIGGFTPSDFARGEIWAGLRPVSPDGMPYVGRFNAYSNLIAATGHAMIGITLAPITGRIVAELVAGVKPSCDITLLHPDRFCSP